MIGFLRTNRDLTLRDHDTYRAYYCGLCHTLSRDHGFLARALNNFEGTFLALLVDAQCERPPELMRSTCIASPLFLRKAVAQNPALEFAAAATVCGVNAKLQDDIADGDAGRIVRLVTRVGHRRVEAAEKKIEDMEFPLDAIRHQWVDQRALEAAGNIDLASAVEPSAQAYATIVAHTARLAGRTENEESLSTIGQELGKVICLLDSYLDYPMDVRLHRFNVLQACLDLGPEDATIRDLSLELSAEVRRSILGSLEIIEATLDQITFTRHAAIIRNVLVQSLRETTQRILVEADASALDTTPKVMGLSLRELVRSPTLVAAVVLSLIMPRNAPGLAIQGTQGVSGNCYDWCYSCCCHFPCYPDWIEECVVNYSDPVLEQIECCNYVDTTCIDPFVDPCICGGIVDPMLESCGCDYATTDCDNMCGTLDTCTGPDCGTGDCGSSCDPSGCATPDCATPNC